MSEETELLSPQMTVLSLINGMIGGFILILPVLALQTGYITTLAVLIITGTFSYFSAYLYVSHIGNESDVDVAIYKHFGGSTKMRSFYDICVWSSLLLVDFLYFELIVIQWVGLAPPHEYTPTNAILNAFLLLGITLAMKYFEFGANLMAYGIISIGIYLIFLGWVVGSEETTGSHADFRPFGEGAVELTAGMGQAFGIQSFFIPILRQSSSTSSNKLVLISYVIGGLAYTYIAFMGSYGILYREYLGYSDGQRTIQGYFGVGTWEVNCIELIYLIHLYSVFPEFLLISKKRLFGVLNYANTPKKKFNAQEIFYIVLAISVCLTITLLKMSIRDIIDLNGAFIGCFIAYIIPAALHIRCLYYSKNKVPVGSKEKPEEQQKYDVMVEENNLELEKPDKGKCDDLHPEQVQNPSKKIENVDEIQMKEVDKYGKKLGEDPVNTYECNCSLEDYSKNQKAVDLCLVVSMVGMSLFIMANGLIDLVG